MTSNFDAYKVDHLFLLVGKNPLPNYVVAKSEILLREGGKPYLVYTTDTKEYADKLREKLCLTVKEMVSLEDAHADAFVIQKHIRDKAERLSGRLGLNYTGGTKAMAVNAYIAIKSLKRDEETVFSYLDPKELKLLIDLSNSSPIPVKIDIEMTFKELFDLHLLELEKSPSHHPTLPKLAELLAVHCQEWGTWCSNVLREQAKRKKASGKIDWESKGKLRNLLLPVDNLPAAIVNELEISNFLDSQRRLSINEMYIHTGFSDVEDACKWLDSVWLEHYLLSKVQTNFPQIGLSFKTSSKIKFEFDVAFLKDYQLFAFSCTSDNHKGTCKLKLFEAYARGKQLGGDEARIALVCCSDDPESLEREITGINSDSKIRVFGRRHLQTIADEVTQWVKEQSRND